MGFILSLWNLVQGWGRTVTPKHIPSFEILVGQGVVTDHIAGHMFICNISIYLYIKKIYTYTYCRDVLWLYDALQGREWLWGFCIWAHWTKATTKGDRLEEKMGNRNCGVDTLFAVFAHSLHRWLLKTGSCLVLRICFSNTPFASWQGMSPVESTSPLDDEVLKETFQSGRLEAVGPCCPLLIHHHHHHHHHQHHHHHHHHHLNFGMDALMQFAQVGTFGWKSSRNWWQWLWSPWWLVWMVCTCQWQSPWPWRPPVRWCNPTCNRRWDMESQNTPDSDWNYGSAGTDFMYRGTWVYDSLQVGPSWEKLL